MRPKGERSIWMFVIVHNNSPSQYDLLKHNTCYLFYVTLRFYVFWIYIATLHDWIVVAIIFYQVCPHCALELPNATRICKGCKKDTTQSRKTAAAENRKRKILEMGDTSASHQREMMEFRVRDKNKFSLEAVLL